MGTIEYRRDIDGLRAIAVLSVILHHINKDFVPGGFTGVDIFFVISGYLITSQIIKNIDEKRFSIFEFYKKRILRILPLLFFIIFLSLLSGVFILSPHDLLVLSKSSLAASVGISNIFLWKEYGNYFSGNTSEAPLLHTWSLAVEEQFYVFWPLFLFIIIRLFKKNHILPILVFVTLLSIAFSEIFTYFAQSASYYLLPSRAFELMMGGLVAYVPKKLNLNERGYGLIFIIGLILVFYSLFFIDKDDSFPGLNAVFPCLGTCLLIASGDKSKLSAILKSKYFVFTGILSYSMYLWHWPLIAYINYFYKDIDFGVALTIIFATYLLSFLTLKLIEQPIRTRFAKDSVKKVVLCFYFLPLAALVLLCTVIVRTDGIKNRFALDIHKMEMAAQTLPNKIREGCHFATINYDETPNFDKCKLGVFKDNPDALLIGDSFANHFSGMIDEIYKVKNLNVIDYTLDSCPPIKEYITDLPPSYQVRCKKRNDYIYSELIDFGFKEIILAANWPNNKKAKEKLYETIEFIDAKNIDITIVVSNVSIKNADKCSIRNSIHNLNFDCREVIGRPDQYILDIKRKFPNIKVINPNEFICDSDSCSPLKDGLLLYRDSSHLNELGSRHLGKLIVQHTLAGVR